MERELKNKILKFQKSEITEHVIYSKLTAFEKKEQNRQVLEKVSLEELKHYNIWRNYTATDVSPDKFSVWRYIFIARCLGITFGLKLMEGGEQTAQKNYAGLPSNIKEAPQIVEEETIHERLLLALIDEDKLKYAGSIVLGLNDALVELTGALAGLTFALQNASLVATAGAITGIAASLSMAASEFLSTKTEPEAGKNPLKAALYTGIAYIFTVTALVTPYLVCRNLIVSLAIMLLNAVVIILAFTFYIAVAKEMNFRRRFLEMSSVSLGVAALSFLIGLAVRALLKIDI